MYIVILVSLFLIQLCDNMCLLLGMCYILFTSIFGRHIFVGFEPTYYRRADIFPGLGGFRHMVFADGFLFPVKELGFWTNPGHWVRVLDAAGSYMYIVL